MKKPQLPPPRLEGENKRLRGELATVRAGEEELRGQAGRVEGTLKGELSACKGEVDALQSKLVEWFEGNEGLRGRKNRGVEEEKGGGLRGRQEWGFDGEGKGGDCC